MSLNNLCLNDVLSLLHSMFIVYILWYKLKVQHTWDIDYHCDKDCDISQNPPLVNKYSSFE